MIRIGLIRHGPTAWNRAGRIQGRSDIPLDAEACAELEPLSVPAPWDGMQLWSSPLLRAADTARLITGHDPMIAPELTEMDWGDWEGRRGVDLLAEPGSGFKHIEDWGWDFRPPGGESVAGVRARLRPWLDALQDDALAVCHIGIMRILLAMAHGWDFDGPPPFRVKRRRIYLLHLTASGLQPGGEPIRLVSRDDTP